MYKFIKGLFHLVAHLLSVITPKAIEIAFLTTSKNRIVFPRQCSLNCVYRTWRSDFRKSIAGSHADRLLLSPVANEPLKCLYDAIRFTRQSLAVDALQHMGVE